MADSEFNWPKKGDQAFGLSADDQSALKAFVMPSEGAYLGSFQRAADMIVAAAQSDDLNPDDLFFPVAYLYRHHLELMLKGLIRLGVRAGTIEAPADCQSEPCPTCGHRKVRKDWQWWHNLHKLWNKAKQLIEEVWPDSPSGDLKAVEQVILEFHKLDRSGQAFRYALDKHGRPHLTGAPQLVDLNNLRSVVDRVSRFLDAAYAGLEDIDPGPP